MRNVYRVMWAAILSSIVAVSMVFVSVPLAAGDLPEERLVKPLRFQAYSPSFQKSIAETHKYIATRLQQLGFQVDFRPENRMGTLQNVYRSRNYDLATLYFGSKPQRLDPHMHMSRWFLSTNRGIGKSNWTGYNNPDYDVIVEASARAFDKEERSRLIHATQAIIARDVPMITLVHQMEVAAYNNKKWSGFKHMVGNGIKNVWSWTEVKPLTDNKTLVIGLSHDTGILTPLKTHLVNNFVCQGVFDTLIRVGLEGENKPWLAQSWEYLSPTEIEFSLRKGVEWHDGKPLTARDVKFTFDYLAKHKVGAHWVAIKVIKEVKLIDDYTVRLILHEPFAPLFVYTLQNTYIIPEHIWKDVPEKTKVEQPDLWAPANEGKFIGSGYLKFEYWRKGDEYKFSVNKSHWTRPAYDAQILKIITTPEAMLGRLKIGEIDAAVVYPWEPTAIKKLCDENPHLTLDLEPTVGFYELSLNTAKKPFSDVRVRQALAGVINRKMIAKEMYSGFAIRAVTPIQPMLKPWFNPNVIRWEEKLGNIERAKEWLAKGGYEWDSKGRIYYPKGVTNEGQDNYQIVVETE